MGIFSKLIAKEKKSETEMLFSAIRAESDLIEKFNSLYEEKVNDVKKILPDWQKGDIDSMRIALDELLLINDELERLLARILSISGRERALFYFILKQKFNQMEEGQTALDYGPMIANYREHLKRIHPYFSQLFDGLQSLQRLIEVQNKELSKKGREGIIAKELIEKGYLYELLADELKIERKIKINVILIIREINEILGYPKPHGLQVNQVDIDGQVREVAKGIVFEEIRDAKSINFEKFYRLYAKSFVSDEIDDRDELEEFINYASLRIDIQTGNIREHLIVGIAKNEVIAFSYFSTIYARRMGICFGHGWWTVIAERYRSMGIAPRLYELREAKMRRDVRLLGAGNLDAIFIDINDPAKMTSSELKTEKKLKRNPYRTMAFMKAQGFVPLRFSHKTPALRKRKGVYYETFMVKPFNPEWIRIGGIPLVQMRSIYWYDYKHAYREKPDTDPTFREVIIDMEKSAVDGIVKFG